MASMHEHSPLMTGSSGNRARDVCSFIKMASVSMTLSSCSVIVIALMSRSQWNTSSAACARAHGNPYASGSLASASIMLSSCSAIDMTSMAKSLWDGSSAMFGCVHRGPRNSGSLTSASMILSTCSAIGGASMAQSQRDASSVLFARGQDGS